MSLNRRFFPKILSITGILAGCFVGLHAGYISEAEARPQIAQPTNQISTATLFAVGDIMLHEAQIKHVHNPRTNTYDFSDYFSLVQPIFATGEWVFGNLETPVAGPEPHGYTGYPRFNAPTALLDALQKAGFTVLSTANSHILDRGIPGLRTTLENIRARDMLPIGTANSEAGAAHIPTITRERAPNAGRH